MASVNLGKESRKYSVSQLVLVQPPEYNSRACLIKQSHLMITTMGKKIVQLKGNRYLSLGVTGKLSISVKHVKCVLIQFVRT